MSDSDESVYSNCSKRSRVGSDRSLKRKKKYIVQEQSMVILREELQKSQSKINELCDLLQLAKVEIDKLKCASSNSHIAMLPTSNGFSVLEEMDVPIGTDKSSSRVAITRQGAYAKRATVNEKGADQSNITKPNKASSAKGKRSDKLAMNGQTGKPKPKQPPPIMAYNIDTKKCIYELKTTLGHDKFGLVRLNNNCTKVITHSLGDYKKTCELMKEGQAEHFTFTPKEEQKRSLLLKGIDRSYDEADIKGALESSNLKINLTKIVRFGRQSSNAPPMWLVQFEPDSDVKSVLETGYLLNQKVQFERLRGGHILQCRRCQRFGHSATNCRLKFRCMKCTEDHGPGECQNVQTDNSNPPAACVNCGQIGHPANFRGCPKYSAIIKLRQEETRKRHEQQLFRQKSVQNLYRNDVTFADLMRPVSAAAHKTNENRTDVRKQTTNTGEGNCLSFLNTECGAYFGMGFAEVIAKIAAFVPKYDQMDATSKPFELIQFMLSITPRT